ncbi:MAG: putative glycosyltransferase [Planctomycetota bacterium]|nr:MAG: putative glycosyltransferase [Planctomycetota bacterium]
MRLSVVATLFRAAARGFAGDDYEIVLVNDGSPDDSLTIALQLQAGDRHVRVVDLSRNFGHHQAMWIGLQHARGESVFLLDSDLEEAPEWLEALEAKQRETKADVVFGAQDTRGGSWLNRFAGAAFYRLFNVLTTTPIPENLMTIRLTFSKGCKPTTSYSLTSRIKLLVNCVTAFSEVPLFLVFYLGLALLASSSLVAGVLVVRWLFFGKMLDGWPSLMVSIWFLGGLCIFCQGILGIYLARVFQETKRRPVAIVRQVYESEGAEIVPLRIAQ